MPRGLFYVYGAFKETTSISCVMRWFGLMTQKSFLLAKRDSLTGGLMNEVYCLCGDFFCLVS